MNINLNGPPIDWFGKGSIPVDILSDDHHPMIQLVALSDVEWVDRGGSLGALEIRRRFQELEDKIDRLTKLVQGLPV